MCRILFSCLLFASSALACARQALVATAGRGGRPPQADTTGRSRVYPIGDAVDVYRTVFDLFFMDGDESPTIIVMHDTAEGHSSDAPCFIACDKSWPHRSKIDTATILGFARLRLGQPRIIPFGYSIPIVFMSWGDEARMRAEGRAHLEENHQRDYVPPQEFVSEFGRKYPGAWGRLRLTGVGFNPAHTEALVQAAFMCGVMCSSDEMLFLKKVDNQWRVIERIPNHAEGFQPSGAMRYRGPAGHVPTESEVLASSDRVPSHGGGAGAEGIDAAMVYRTVLDSLYNFHGELPGRIVIADSWPIQLYPLPAHTRPIQPSTLERYTFMRGVRAPLYERLKLQAPVSILSRDSMPALEQLGHTVEKQVSGYGEAIDPSPFWLGFRQRYPGAWGTVGFTRVAFNLDRTQALVLTHHTCGTLCYNADTWLLERAGEAWRIVERIPREKDRNWGLDPLRYLGVDANPLDYRPRRIHGVFVTAATGRALPGLNVMVERGSRHFQLITDSSGGYSVDSLPLMGGILLKVRCPVPSARREPLLVAMLPSRAGLDSTMNVSVDFRRCLRHRRARALDAGANPSTNSLGSKYPNAEEAAVYRGVLDALYPVSGSRKGPILLQPVAHRFWKFDVEAEIPRLIREAVVDSSIEKSLDKLPNDSAWLRPDFGYRRRVVILGPAEQSFLLDQRYDFLAADPKRDVSLTTLAKEAYPGASAILSLSRVAFNDAHTQALVQVSSGESPPYDGGETIVLHKGGTAWRVVRRHLELERTSGERVGDKCEPGDAPTSVPRLKQLERLVGDADITVNPTSPQMRRYAGTSRYNFIPTDSLHRFHGVPAVGDKRNPDRTKGRQKLATVQVINDSTGKPRTGRDGSLTFDHRSALLTFSDDAREADGSMEQFKILRVSGREFFGSWLTGGGQMMPWKGYFCGRLR